MTDTLYLDIIVPDRRFFSDTVQEFTVKTPGGEIGVLSGHIPLTVAVSIGPVRIKKDDQWRPCFLSEGYMEMIDNKAVILADAAEWPEEIDPDRARAAEKRARERLETKLDHLEHRYSESALQRALCRLKVAESSKPKA